MPSMVPLSLSFSVYIHCRLSSSDAKFDIVVVGGGIVGLATARELNLRYPQLTFAVLEKEKELGMYSSKSGPGTTQQGS